MNAKESFLSPLSETQQVGFVFLCIAALLVYLITLAHVASKNGKPIIYVVGTLAPIAIFSTLLLFI